MKVEDEVEEDKLKGGELCQTLNASSTPRAF